MPPKYSVNNFGFARFSLAGQRLSVIVQFNSRTRSKSQCTIDAIFQLTKDLFSPAWRFFTLSCKFEMGEEIVDIQAALKVIDIVSGESGSNYARAVHYCTVFSQPTSAWQSISET
jgi:hypothetical protein